nr:hypothetical protein Iba_chr11bCG4300 [Ipomoea batatas]GMD56626.1 hypothetical protein Iba_chr11eCG4970 [Ipomoea batatas]
MEDTVIQKILSGELHNGTDNVSTVGLESLNSVGPGNTCLCHDQINITRFNSSLVNLFFFLVCLHSSRSGGGGVWLGNDRAHVWHPELLGSLCLELRAQIFYLGLPKNYLVADVDDKGVRAGFDGQPLAVLEDLKAGDLQVLKKNGERIRVGVSGPKLSDMASSILNPTCRTSIT